ncbi:MAG: nitronate monooxygenase [Myxococcales bacterium]|nr:nitronate monooxygenase [Myxococcales bacterium]
MASPLHTPLCDLLGIEYPIIQAGMAIHGSEAVPPSPVGLVAAVTNAGGLGVLGDNFRDLDEMDAAISETKRLTAGRPYGVDFLIPASRIELGTTDNREAYQQAIAAHPRHAAFVAGLIEEHGLTAEAPAERAPISSAVLRRKIELVLDHHVPVFAAAAGEPPDWFVQRGHAQGMRFIGMCGAVRHAQRHVRAGADIITAQGTEAGGHTGNVATFVLVPQIVAAVRPLPVLAAGGIGTGRQVAAALALGAQGAWVGTAFLTSEETGIPAPHQAEILSSASEAFTLSKYASGLQQRGHVSPIKEAWGTSGLEALPFPIQRLIQEPLLRAARKAGRWDLVPNLAGQVAGMLTERRPARDILLDMVEEAAATIAGLQRVIA